MEFALKKGNLMLESIKQWFLDENILDTWIMTFEDITYKWKRKNYVAVSVLMFFQVLMVPAVICSVCVSAYMLILGFIVALLLIPKDLLNLD